MGAKNFSHSHRSIMCGLKKLASFEGFPRKVGKYWQNGGGEDGGRNEPKTISPPVTRGDLNILTMIILAIINEHKYDSYEMNNIHMYSTSTHLPHGSKRLSNIRVQFWWCLLFRWWLNFWLKSHKCLWAYAAMQCCWWTTPMKMTAIETMNQIPIINV